MDGTSVDNTIAGRSLNFRGSDGRSLDIGDGDNNMEEDDEKSDSEGDRIERYGPDANNASNGLSHVKMMNIMDEIHPREKTEDPETKAITYKAHGLCKSTTGFHDCCSRKRRHSDFDSYGVGTVLYFQFLKYMGCVFFIMSLLGIPAMLFFYYGTNLSDTSLSKIVTAASLGNLGSSSNICNTADFDLTSANASSVDPYAYIQLSCPFGELWDISQFGQVSISEEIDCQAAVKVIEESGGSAKTDP